MVLFASCDHRETVVRPTQDTRLTQVGQPLDIGLTLVRHL